MTLTPVVSDVQNPPPAKVCVRRATVADIPWMLKLGAQHFDNISNEDSGQFLYYAMQTPHFLVVRTDHAFGCAIWEPWVFNHAQKHAHEIFLATDGTTGWDAYNIAKEMVKWARENNCDIIQFDPKSNLDPVMKRLGFATQQPSYRLNLKPVH